MLEMKITGLKELEKSMSQLGKEYSDPKFALKALRPAMKKSVKGLEEDIRNTTPIDTGKLKDSVTTRVRQSTKKDKEVLGRDSIMVADVGWHWVKGKSLFRQALSVEYGNAVTTAQPTLRPALSKNSNQIIESFVSELKISIEKKATALEKKFSSKIQ